MLIFRIRHNRVRKSLDVTIPKFSNNQNFEMEYGDPQNTSNKFQASNQSLFKEFLLLHKDRAPGTSHSNTHLYSGCETLKKDTKSLERMNMLKTGSSFERKETNSILPGMSTRYPASQNISYKLRKILVPQKRISEKKSIEEVQSSIEEIRQEYEKQIEELKHENSMLKERIKQLEELNDKLQMSSSDTNKDAEVQSFYQNIFITDLQKELDRKDVEISHFKLRILEDNDAYDKLHQKNLKSSKIIKMYRDMIHRQKEKESTKDDKNNTQELTKSQFDSFMDPNAEIYEIERELMENHIVQAKGPSNKIMDNEMMNEILSSFHNTSDSTTIVLQKLYNDIKEISRQNKINDLFETAEGILVEMFSKNSGFVRGNMNTEYHNTRRGRATFLICNPVVLQAFNMEKKGYASNISIDGYQVYIANSNQIFNKKSKIKRYNKIRRASEREFPFEP